MNGSWLEIATARLLRRLTLAVLAIVASATALDAQLLGLSTSTPTVGEPVQVQALAIEDPDPIDGQVRAIYRPGSQFEVREELGTISRDGLIWTPRQAGLVRLQLETADGKIMAHDVAVRLGHVSVSGFLVMLAAGSLLTAGAVLGFRRHR